MEFDIVEQGEVIVDHLTVTKDDDDVKLIYGDLTTKYAEVYWYSSSWNPDIQRHEMEVALRAPEGAFNVARDSNVGAITLLRATFADDSKHWHWTQLASIGRYTLNWIIWRHPTHEDAPPGGFQVVDFDDVEYVRTPGDRADTEDLPLHAHD